MAGRTSPSSAELTTLLCPAVKATNSGNETLQAAAGYFPLCLRKKLNDEELANYLDNFSLFSMAYSWGGYESLIPANQPEHIAAIRPQGEIDLAGP